MPALRRLFTILIGYVAAALSAALVLNLLALLVSAFAGDLSLVEGLAGTFVGILVFAPSIAFYALIPALGIILLSELFRLRGRLFHACAGGIAAICAIYILYMDAQDSRPADPTFVMALICAGVAGGMVYWYVAGRAAGTWSRRRSEAQATAPAP